MKARQGIALLLALVVLLLIEAFAAGMLALSTQARAIAFSSVRSTRAKLASEMAVRRVLIAWAGGRYDTLPEGTTLRVLSGATDDESWTAEVERSSSGFLVRGNALVGGAGAFSLAASNAFVRMLNRRRALEELNAAITAKGITVVAGEAKLVGALAGMPPDWQERICPAIDPLPPPAALRTGIDPLIAAGVTIAGTALTDSTLVADTTAFAGIQWAELEGIADRIERGSLVPGPVADGSKCDFAAPGNWGDPKPGQPCSAYFPLIFSDGDLTIAGGRGQGVIAVKGTLTITGSATFVGVVVARDGLILGPGAQLFGAAGAAGFTLVDGAAVTYSRCAVALALNRTLAAQRPILQPRTFIPAF